MEVAKEKDFYYIDHSLTTQSSTHILIPTKIFLNICLKYKYCTYIISEENLDSIQSTIDTMEAPRYLLLTCELSSSTPEEVQLTSIIIMFKIEAPLLAPTDLLFL